MNHNMLARLLALAAAFSLLSGCGQTRPSQQPQPTPSAVPQQTVTTPVPSPKETQHRAPDGPNASSATPAPTPPSAGDGQQTADERYILNTNSHKFHLPGCSSIDSMKEQNKREYAGSRDELISLGYSPCQRCFP